jgi:hypothetical protein
MNVECSRCGDRKYIPEPVNYGMIYRCRSCRAVLVVAREESAGSSKIRSKFVIPAQQALMLLIIPVLLLGTFGRSAMAAKAETEHLTPLEGILAVLAGAPADTVTLLDNVQEVVAQYERSIVAESVQLMRISEGVREVTPVTEPTNDMAAFPTPENPLFPEYLSWKYSQFDYTVDGYGIVSVETASLSENIFN